MKYYRYCTQKDQHTLLSDSLANNILKVSNLMRYSLESLEGEDGKVLLKDEIHYVNIAHLAENI